jgi:Tfp pilus assembly protein PilZ
MADIGGDGEEFDRVHDIGPGGVCLSTESAVQVGDTIKVKLRFPDLWEEIEIGARVCWIDEDGKVGLAIEEIEDEIVARLDSMIDEQERLGKMALLC